jgi:hypothetical protein
MREQDALAKQLIEGQRMLTELFLAIEEDSNIDD